MRIFTCTPVAFGGGADFFARDSGLLCRGFQAVGIESRAVMPGERKSEDQEDLIRTDFSNLESAEWWREHDLDGVVLYAWGSPKFRKVARAIHEAGIFLVLNQDNGGLVSPLAGFRGWWQDQRNLSGGGLAFWKHIAKGLSHGLLVTDPLRAAHLRCGNVIACVSPRAAMHYRRLCRIYGGKALADKVRVLPHAVESRFRYPQAENSLPGCVGDRASSLESTSDGAHGRQDARTPGQAGSLSSTPVKSRQVACVGRWNDRVQKRPHLLMEVIGRLVAVDESVTVVIAGNPVDELWDWHGALPQEQRDRVQLRGKVGRDELVKLLDDSQVFYSPSAFESFGIAAAEALCCGCSVVAAESVSMTAFEWFVSEQSGRLATADITAAHLAALQAELDDWAHGSRNPDAISRTWCARLHADRVAGQVVEWLMRSDS